MRNFWMKSHVQTFVYIAARDSTAEQEWQRSTAERWVGHGPGDSRV